MNSNQKVVKSYNNVWRISRTFYTIGGFDLPMPVSLNFMLYFMLSIVPMHMFGGLLPSFIRYLLIPGGIAWIFDQRMLDGKNPFQFARSVVIHYYLVLFKGYKINRFRHYRAEYPSIETTISHRTHKALE